MPKTKAQIIAEAQVVKNATEVGENTATRVGGVLEDLADADSVVIIPVTGTSSGGNITLSSNPFTQVQTTVNAGQHVVVRVTIASDIIDFTMNTYSASVATYIGTANFLENEFQLLCNASKATITNRSTSNTFTTGEEVPNIGIDATPTQGSDNLVKSGGVWNVLKLIEDNVQTILDTLGEYAFPDGKPQISWEGDTPTPTIYDAEVEYLQSSGTQVIDSGVGGNLETEITNKFQTLSTINVAVLGSRGSNTESIQIYVANGGTQRFGSGSANVSFRANADYTVNFNKTKMTVNGINYNINTSTDFTTPTNIFFFGSNSAKGSFKISSVQITQNGTLVRDFIPVRVGTTGYMYDNVTQQ